MLSLTSEQIDALQKRHIMRRIFIWIDALDPDGNPSPLGTWDDVGNVTLDDRTYYGSIAFGIATLSAKTDFSIPGLQVTFSGVAPAAAALVRGNVVAQRPIEVMIGIFDVDSQAVIPPLIKRFIGIIDDVDINTPAAGDKSTITLTCESISRALTIKRTGTRSQSTAVQRNPSDKFYDYAAGQRDQTIYFGRAAPKT
jgi:hypothetical protein